MDAKVMKDWFLDVPWGRLAMVSWGESTKPPVLLIHGFVDSAASFIPLVNAMPDDYYYVSFDLPGHGRSDSMPGPPICYQHFLEAVRQIVDQMCWDTFNCVAHSMGYLISACYNAAFPGRILRVVGLAGMIGIGYHALTDHPQQWFQLSFDSYYRRYFPPPPPKTYTYEEAVRALAKSRGVSEELGAMLATRCIEPTSDGRVRFTWDVKAKKQFTMPISEEILCNVLSVPLPTLCLMPTEDEVPNAFPNYTAAVLTKLTNELVFVDVPGGHNMHVSDPGSVVPHIVRFFSEDCVRSKL